VCTAQTTNNDITFFYKTHHRKVDNCHRGYDFCELRVARKIRSAKIARKNPIVGRLTIVVVENCKYNVLEKVMKSVVFDHLTKQLSDVMWRIAKRAAAERAQHHAVVACVRERYSARPPS
jgi:hypothetical protein